MKNQKKEMIKSKEERVQIVDNKNKKDRRIVMKKINSKKDQEQELDLDQDQEVQKRTKRNKPIKIKNQKNKVINNLKTNKKKI